MRALKGLTSMVLALSLLVACAASASNDPVAADPNTGAHFNRYSYANNNPYKFTDPDGRQSRELEFEYKQSGATPPPPTGVSLAEWGAAEFSCGFCDLNSTAPAGSGAVESVVTPMEFAAASGMARGLGAAAGAATTGATAETGAASTLKPGPFAGESISARSSAQTFTSGERAAVNEIGSTTGCHTCGSTAPGTKSGNFVPDHQPVSSLNSASAPQRLYPQCLNCSRQQGLEAARELRKKDP